LPACALVAWGVPRLVAEVRETVPRPLDVLGVMLLTAALAVLVEALLLGRTSTLHLAGGLVLSALLLAAFAIQQRRLDKPILDPGVFVQPAMIGIAILLFAVSIGYWAVLVYLPLFFAAVYDWSSEVAGLALLTATLPMLFLPPLGGWLVGRVGWRLHFALALAIVAAGNVAIAIALMSSGAAPSSIDWQIQSMPGSEECEPPRSSRQVHRVWLQVAVVHRGGEVAWSDSETSGG